MCIVNQAQCFVIKLESKASYQTNPQTETGRVTHYIIIVVFQFLMSKPTVYVESFKKDDLLHESFR